MLGKRSSLRATVSVVKSVESRRRFVGLASSEAPLGTVAAASFCFCCCSSRRCLSALARFFASFSRFCWTRAASSSGSAAAHLDVDDIVY